MRLPNLCLSLLLVAPLVCSQPQPPVADGAAGQPVQLLVRQHSAAELQQLLQQAEDLSGAAGPVVLVLLGDEIRLFERARYREQKALVDLAARLQAFNRIELKLCQTYLAAHGVSQSDFPSFLHPVPDGPAEIMRLQQQGYVSF